jgi:hypothetical protein
VKLKLDAERSGKCSVFVKNPFFPEIAWYSGIDFKFQRILSEGHHRYRRKS